MTLDLTDEEARATVLALRAAELRSLLIASRSTDGPAGSVLGAVAGAALFSAIAARIEGQS